MDQEEEHQLLEELYQQFSGLKTKEEVLEVLETTNRLLHRIPIVQTSYVSLEQAKKDFHREKVLFNDVPFIPDSQDDSRSQAFVLTLQVLVQRMIGQCQQQQQQHQESLSTERVCEQILQRACRTSAGADSFFMVQRLLCSHNNNNNNQDTFVSQKTVNQDPPIKIDVFLSSSSSSSSSDDGNDVSLSLCTRIEVRNSFNIFDMDMFDQITGRECDDPFPFLEIEAIVIDESDFTTEKHWRRLQLVVSCPLKGKVFLDKQQQQQSRLSGRLLIHELTSCFNNINNNNNNTITSSI